MLDRWRRVQSQRHPCQPRASLRYRQAHPTLCNVREASKLRHEDELRRVVTMSLLSWLCHYDRSDSIPRSISPPACSQAGAGGAPLRRSSSRGTHKCRLATGATATLRQDHGVPCLLQRGSAIIEARPLASPLCPFPDYKTQYFMIDSCARPDRE